MWTLYLEQYVMTRKDKFLIRITMLKINIIKIQTKKKKKTDKHDIYLSNITPCFILNDKTKSNMPRFMYTFFRQYVALILQIHFTIIIRHRFKFCKRTPVVTNINEDRQDRSRIDTDDYLRFVVSRSGSIHRKSRYKAEKQNYALRLLQLTTTQR